MADYAGAVAAIIARFEADWVDGLEARTRIAKVNEVPDDPWPPRGEAWVLIEVQNADAQPHAFGTPGHIGYRYLGTVLVHVFVPVGSGTAEAFALAVLAGEVFRNRLLYDDVTPGAYVRTMAPHVDGGGPGDDDGVWFRVTASTAFEYLHRG